jgi:hypothetical protein
LPSISEPYRWNATPYRALITSQQTAALVALHIAALVALHIAALVAPQRHPHPLCEGGAVETFIILTDVAYNN